MAKCIADLRARCDVAVGGDVALGPRQARHHAVVAEHDLRWMYMTFQFQAYVMF